MNDVAIQQVAVSKGDIEPFSYRKLIAWSWRVVSHAPAIFALSVAIGVGVQLLPLALLQIVNDLVGGLQSGRDPSSFAGLAEIFFVLTILLVVGQLGGDAVAAISDSRMLRWLQQTLHERILSQGPSYHDRHDVGENSTVVLQDAAGGQVVMRTVIASPVTLSFGFVGALVLLFQNLSKVGDMPGWIQAILLVSLVLVPIFGWRLQNSVGTAAAVGRSFMGELNNEFMNSASTPLEVQLLGALPQRNAAFGQRLDAYLKAKTRTTIRLTLSKAFGVSAPDVLRAGFMLVGVLLASHMPDAVAAKAILGIYFFVPAALAPVQQIVSFAGNLRMSWPSVSRVGALLDAADDSPASATLPAADLARVLVSLDHVTFTYPGAPAPVLRELTHSFAPGVVTAIVGRAGTGKSSIIGLIDGLRRADSGTVRLAGRDVAQIESTALRNAVAVVSQFPMFITDTVRANFQLAKPDVADAEIEDICRRIGLWDTFVRLSPNAPLDHRMSRTAGKDLSGGERGSSALPAYCCASRPSCYSTSRRLGSMR